MSEQVAKLRFREIVVPHLDAAYTLARWMTGDGAQAEDVVQDAAVRALAALAAATPLKPRAWWLAIVRNVALTALAKRTTTPAGEELDAAADAVEPGLDPEAALIARDETERVRRAIARLPTPLRETLILREIEELDYREIAAATEAPIGTVMSRLSRARVALARMLGSNP